MDRLIFKLVRDVELDDSFRIHVEFTENNFHLTILKKATAWAATVDQQNICTQAKQHEVSTDEYFKKVQEYFKESKKSVDYSFNNNEFVIKYNVDNNMKIKYFSCKLKSVNYSDCVESLMEKLYNERNNSLERFINVDVERRELKTNNHLLESKLHEFIERKKTEDQELYNSFVLVLNEKKRQIQHLNELLETFRRGRPTSNPHVIVKKRSKKNECVPQIKTEIKEDISDSESESYDTDEEKAKIVEHLVDEDGTGDINRNKQDIEAQPSTSKYNYDLFSEDSPPRHLLPKRIKSETIKSIDSNSVNKPCSSNQSSKNNKHNEIHQQTVDSMPSVNFSTQDLLDNI